MQERGLIAGEEAGGADLDVGAEEVTESGETSGEEIGFGMGLGDDNHRERPVRGGGSRRVKEK